MVGGGWGFTVSSLVNSPSSETASKASLMTCTITVCPKDVNAVFNGARGTIEVPDMANTEFVFPHHAH